MDTVSIRGLRVFAYHGVKEEEKRKGQPFVVHVEMHYEHNRAADTDILEDTVNYSTVSKHIIAYMARVKRDTIERVAGELAEEILAAFPLIDAIAVTIEKPRAPIAADFEFVSARVERSRKE